MSELFPQIHVSLSPKEIPFKLFLDMVTSSSLENVTMHIASQGCFSSRIKLLCKTAYNRLPA